MSRPPSLFVSRLRNELIRSHGFTETPTCVCGRQANVRSGLCAECERQPSREAAPYTSQAIES